MPNPPNNAQALIRALQSAADPKLARILNRFFKTGPGEYGAGDRFLGLPVPRTRKILQPYLALPLSEVRRLLIRPEHECRLAALLILVRQCSRADATERSTILDFYLEHTAYVNNWDLVDSSARDIVGACVPARDLRLLRRLAQSASLWENRIAIVATHFHIRAGQSTPTIDIATRLLHHPHDLIHKAVGWMLRELGKRDGAALRQFLDTHAATMPRTMLRYAIERMNKNERNVYMKMKSLI